MADIIEKRGDLFKCPETSSMAHCVSEDLSMSKGIAVVFKNKYKGLDELKTQKKKPGDVAVLKRDGRFIYYMITKERYFHKPTYLSLESSLVMMRLHCVENGVQQLAIPRIGCGLDRLEWTKVKNIISTVFKNTGITISVYTL